MMNSFGDKSLRWSDDLRAAEWRLREDMQAAFRVIGERNRDPNDPRLMTVVLRVM